MPRGACWRLAPLQVEHPVLLRPVAKEVSDLSSARGVVLPVKGKASLKIVLFVVFELAIRAVVVVARSCCWNTVFEYWASIVNCIPNLHFGVTGSTLLSPNCWNRKHLLQVRSQIPRLHFARLDNRCKSPVS